MTIDESIEDLIHLKMCGVLPFSKGTISGNNYRVVTEECLDIAVDTMRKYQKIKEIVKNNNGLFDGTLEHDKAFVEICKVVEDGNKLSE